MRLSCCGGGSDWRVIVGLSLDLEDAIGLFQVAFRDLQEVNETLIGDTKSYQEMNQEVGLLAASLQDMRPVFFAHRSNIDIGHICQTLLDLGVDGLPERY